MKRELIVTVGLPRSGKTTWAQAQGFPIVNPDSIRLALHGQRFAAAAEPFVWAVAQTMAKALFMAGNGTVIVDATNVTEKRRKVWGDIATECEAEVSYVIFDTMPEVCKERAIATGQEDLLPVIDRMWRTWDFPEDKSALHPVVEERLRKAEAEGRKPTANEVWGLTGVFPKGYA